MRWKLSRAVLRGEGGGNAVLLLDQRTEGRKQPFFFRMRDERPFGFAGLWERWEGEGGRVVNSCAILTTEANEVLRPVHDRMPVILHPDDYELWLGGGERELGLVKEMLRPYPPEEMLGYPVGASVNSPGVRARVSSSVRL